MISIKNMIEKATSILAFRRLKNRKRVVFSK